MRLPAHNVPKVDRALRPSYGDALIVRPGPYGRTELQLSEGPPTLADQEDVHLALGGGLDFDENTIFLDVS